ncbi:MAG: ATP-binding protein [Campylobacterales bacterium]|nr:ATP-binding protein [Campylobacterales bacterium]
MQMLPIGIQTFQKIRSDDYVYIDKTPEALKLIHSGHQYFFLSRPRRFGKSLFIDTLHNIFDGKQELFEQLHIHDKYDWSKRYPVIRMDFGNQKAKTPEKLALYIKNRLFDIAQHYDVEINREEYYEIFKELITNLQEKYNQKVVILIDEYDKPILDNIEDIPLAKEMREILRGFYTIIKGADADLRFAFLTGVSKFAKASIFSGLNNLYDISLDTDYATICGYTQEDLERSFKAHLKDADMDEIKRWYNGYSWLGEAVYNPFDILLFIQNRCEFKNYWFETGTPTFLIKLMKEKQYFLPNLADLEAGDSLINSFDIEDLDVEAILFQAGYLTIKEKHRIGALYMYRLKVPNIEVQTSLNDHLLKYIEPNQHTKTKHQSGIYKALSSCDLEALKTNLIALYASISHHNFTKNQIDHYEGFYASVIYAYLASLGVDLIAEDITNKGRIDLSIKMDHAIYIFEFKVDAKDALSQIKSKRYQEKYLSADLPIFLIGIEFDSHKRNISKMEWESV